MVKKIPNSNPYQLIDLLLRPFSIPLPLHSHTQFQLAEPESQGLPQCPIRPRVRRVSLKLNNVQLNQKQSLERSLLKKDQVTISKQLREKSVSISKVSKRRLDPIPKIQKKKIPKKTAEPQKQQQQQQTTGKEFIPKLQKAIQVVNREFYAPAIVSKSTEVIKHQSKLPQIIDLTNTIPKQSHSKVIYKEQPVPLTQQLLKYIPISKGCKIILENQVSRAGEHVEINERPQANFVSLVQDELFIKMQNKNQSLQKLNNYIV